MDSPAVPVNYAPGRLPAFWDRSVVFFANLLGMFYGNEGATRELIECVGGVETYGGRLCPLVNLLFTGSGNLLVLESQPDERLLEYFAQDLGLDLPEVVVLPHREYQDLPDRLTRAADPREHRYGAGGSGWPAEDLAIARIAEHPAGWIDGFVTDEVLTRAAEVLNKRTIIAPEASRRGNNKLLLHRFVEAQGFPAFDTVVVETARELPEAAELLRRRGYRQVVAKAQVGASGIGMCKFDTVAPAIAGRHEHLFYEGPVLVQGWIDNACDETRLVGSPSMQLFLDETSVNVYDVTEQILSEDSVHEGNSSPPPFWGKSPEIEEQMRRQTCAVGRWLHATGYRGTASVDFLVAERAGEIRVFVCEVNARVTGATYPSVLARRFCPAGHWLMRNLRFEIPVRSEDLLADLRRAGHLLDGGSDEGVLPVNFNLSPEGTVAKGQFLCIGPDEHTCFEYLMAAAGVLPVKWTYDRD